MAGSRISNGPSARRLIDNRGAAGRGPINFGRERSVDDCRRARRGKGARDTRVGPGPTDGMSNGRSCAGASAAGRGRGESATIYYARRAKRAWEDDYAGVIARVAEAPGLHKRRAEINAAAGEDAPRLGEF